MIDCQILTIIENDKSRFVCLALLLLLRVGESGKCCLGFQNFKNLFSKISRFNKMQLEF